MYFDAAVLFVNHDIFNFIQVGHGHGHTVASFTNNIYLFQTFTPTHKYTRQKGMTMETAIWASKEWLFSFIVILAVLYAKDWD